MTDSHEPSSFRDSSGFLVRQDNVLLRCIRISGMRDLDTLFESGLYQQLVDKQLLVAHEEAEIPEDYRTEVARCLRPEELPFISYPYEWSASQLRDAALLTLRVLELSVKHGMILKDASAFNVSFKGCRPVFLDILSFTCYDGVSPWAGYRQFCEHMLLPVLLSTLVGQSAPALLSRWIHGIPMHIGWHLLPWRVRLRPVAAMHIGFHQAMITRTASGSNRQVQRSGTSAVLPIVRHLRNGVRSTRIAGGATSWSDYRGNLPYSDLEVQLKDDAVKRLIESIAPRMVWDIGCNDGRYSKIAADRGCIVVALDADAQVISRLYETESGEGRDAIHPLVQDLAQPSPALGWGLEERQSLTDRGPADLVLFLAVIHHLRFAQGIPLDKQIRYLASIGKHALVEWVPPSDENVLKYKNRPELNGLEYTDSVFFASLVGHFTIEDQISLGESGRTLLFLKGTN